MERNQGQNIAAETEIIDELLEFFRFTSTRRYSEADYVNCQALTNIDISSEYWPLHEVQGNPLVPIQSRKEASLNILIKPNIVVSSAV